jgi:FKBP12-rapamycin complex-associated protein
MLTLDAEFWQSPSASRVAAAESLMQQMREHSATLVDQALLVSQELIRIAILWHEQWYDGLEEAYRLFLEQVRGDSFF